MGMVEMNQITAKSLSYYMHYLTLRAWQKNDRKTCLKFPEKNED